jgi:iron(III) transport system substrate-binding protein
LPQQQKDEELQKYAYEIKARAMRRIGEMSREIETSERARTDLPTSAGVQTKTEVLAEAGLTPSTALRYEKLADAKLKGKLCIRSGSHPYNLSLFGAMTEHIGPQQTEIWLKGLVNNLARNPAGGDTDQIKGVASGECAVAVTNTYYLARLMRSTNPAEKAMVDKVAVVFPNQASWGTHLNIAGGAVAKNSKNQNNALKFLEYLASTSAQNHFANGNNEWPAAKGMSFDNPALKAMSGGVFKSEVLPVSAVGMNQIKVQQMLDRVGFK